MLNVMSKLRARAHTHTVAHAHDDAAAGACEGMLEPDSAHMHMERLRVHVWRGSLNKSS